MAQRRTIKKKISVSEQVSNLSDKAQILYTWSILHADDLSLLPKSAKTLKATIFPMREDILLDEFKKLLKELEDEELLENFEYGGEEYYKLPNFHKHQTFKKDRPPITLIGNIAWEQAMEVIGFQMEDNGIPSKLSKLSKLSKVSKVKLNNIYIHYQKKINGLARLTDKSKTKIKARLNTYKEEELLKAMDNFSKQEWWMENNKHRGVAWFFNTDDRIDNFLNFEGVSQEEEQKRLKPVPKYREIINDKGQKIMQQI